jgi:GxxExxY protein
MKGKKMIEQEFVFRDEGYQLLGACFEVYNVLGFGLAEELYQEAVEIELQLRGISNVSRPKLTCIYKDRQLRKTYFPDFVVFGSVVVELKAVRQLEEEHYGQILNYLRITQHPVGYLVNFGKRGGLDYKRFLLSEFVKVTA